MKYKLMLDRKKRLLFKRNEINRIGLRINLRFKASLKLKSIVDLDNLLKNSSFSKIKNRCALTNRSKSVYKKTGFSRIKMRELILIGALVGYQKSAW